MSEYGITKKGRIEVQIRSRLVIDFGEICADLKESETRTLTSLKFIAEEQKIQLLRMVVGDGGDFKSGGHTMT